MSKNVLVVFLQLILSDRVSPRQFYERTSFMRDPEALGFAAGHLAGIETCRFALATNAGILNRWQTPPLVMAGLWVPDKLEEDAPTEAEDVVVLMEQEEDESLSGASSLSSLDIR